MTLKNPNLTVYYKTADKGVIYSVWRWGKHPEHWVNGKWVNDGYLINAFGIGGDTNFEPATEAEVNAFIKTHS